MTILAGATGPKLPADAVSTTTGILLAEDGATKVGVTGYDVAFDAERDLWYTDIEIDPSGAYFPFIKLALVRYQPYSIGKLPGTTTRSMPRSARNAQRESSRLGRATPVALARSS